MSEQTMQYQVDPEVIFTELDAQEGVLLHLVTRRYYSLNETACLIWKGLAQNKTPAEISGELRALYEVEDPLGYVRAFLEELHREGLVRPV